MNEEKERLKLESEAKPYTLAALLAIDRAIVTSLKSHGSIFITSEAQTKASESLTKSRQLAWNWLSIHAADEAQPTLREANDAAKWALASIETMKDTSIKLAQSAEVTNSGKANQSKNILDARRNDRADIWASAAVNEAVENGKFEIVKALSATAILKLTTKSWRTVGDSRVRPTHRAANGQVVGLNDYFNVGGFMLSHPRDYAAPAHETAHCRCSAIYSLNWNK
jgi:hypothetical protein